MHHIESKKTKKRYPGLKPKLIHLDPKVFQMLDMTAKLKNITLKKYLEELCTKQAHYEVKKIQEEVLNQSSIGTHKDQ